MVTLDLIKASALIPIAVAFFMGESVARRGWRLVDRLACAWIAADVICRVALFVLTEVR